MDILISSLYFLVFCFCIWKLPFFQLQGISKKWTLATFSLKVAVGFLLWAIYSFHYHERESADIFKYYDDAQIIYDLAGAKLSLIFQILTGIVWNEKEVSEILLHTNHWFRSFDYIQINDNRTIIRINLLFLSFSAGIFHVHTILFCFLAFIGSAGLYKFISFFDSRKAVVYLCSFLLPSVLFWTSGILKESWLLFVLGLLLLHFQHILLKFSTRRLLAILLLVLAFLFIKPFVFLLLLPALLYLLFQNLLTSKKPILLFLLLHLLLLASALLFITFGTSTPVFALMQAQQNAFYAIAEEIGNVGTIQIPEVYNLQKAFLAAPSAIFNTLFRPFIWEADNLLQLVAAVENIGYLLLFLLAAAFFRKPRKKSLLLVLFCISFVCALSVLIGWTTPILGTIVRYKVPLLPFFAILLCQFIDFNKLKNIFKHETD